MLAAETAALHAEQGLSGRLTALATALARAVAAAGGGSGGGSSSGGSGGGSSGGGSGGGSSGGGSGGGSKGSGAGGGGRTASGGSGGSPVSAAQLAADQAAADAAAAQVTVAQQNLADATVVSPISGTVVTVSATPGTAETAGDLAFEIAGLDSYQVVTQVPVTDMPQLKVGQPASVLPDGASAPLSGSVVSIGLIPDSTGSPTTYPVTIGLAGQPSGLHPDGYASVTITTARSSGVSVPTSAVHKSGGTGHGHRVRGGQDPGDQGHHRDHGAGDDAGHRGPAGRPSRWCWPTWASRCPITTPPTRVPAALASRVRS